MADALTESMKDVGLLLFDPGTLCVLGCALFCISYGAYRSQQFYAAAYGAAAGSASSSTGRPRSGTTEKFGSSVSVVQKSTAVLLPILASIMLLVLFYFLNMIYYLLLIAILFGAFTSMCFVQWPLWELIVFKFNAYVPRCPTAIPTIDCIGPIPLELILSLPIPIGLMIGYFFTNSWVFTDIFAFCIIIFSLSTLRIPNMLIAAMLLCFFFCYDLFWVFLSSFIFGDNVMVAVARGATEGFHWNLPIALQIPMVLTDGQSLLGVGDIVMPGLFLCYLYRFDCRRQGHPMQGYFINGMIGYVAGIWLALTMLVITEMAQPALIYLVPCTLIPAVVLGASRRELKALWYGGHKPTAPIGENDAEIELEEMGESPAGVAMSADEDLVVGDELVVGEELVVEVED
mmetsp:Transcript_15676/g.61229  ORF Transcript_15676/g.61229 Transcript_15676/m.61229 type:complete len:402 (+) Transcript_15676:49-1254(+)